jgi:hypothetical protein
MSCTSKARARTNCISIINLQLRRVKRRELLRFRFIVARSLPERETTSDSSVAGLDRLGGFGIMPAAVGMLSSFGGKGDLPS